jgi:hypothetical protein
MRRRIAGDRRSTLHGCRLKNGYLADRPGRAGWALEAKARALGLKPLERYG